MAQAHPLLTNFYLWVSFIVLGFVELPLLGLFLARRVHQRTRARPEGPVAATIAILVGAVVLNAGIFAISSGQDANIRYGLPSYLLLAVGLLWAGMIAVRALLLPTPSPALQVTRA